MFCSRCGSPVRNEHTNFCYNCGYALNPYNAPLFGKQDFTYASRIPVAEKSGRKKHNTIKIIAVCLVFALIFIILIDAGETWNENRWPSEKVEIQTVTADTYFELSGDFLPEREIFTVNLTDDGKMAFALDDRISARYDYYSWSFFDNDHVSSTNTLTYSEYTGETVNKAEPVLYYLSQNVGEYSISVKCYVESGGQRVYSAVYSGTVTYVGTITKEYTWMYQGTKYSAETSFSYDEYRFYKNTKPNGRWVTDYSKVVSFVAYKDPAVSELAESLREAYGIDRNTSDQSFAAFVLGFIQICFEYPPSSALMPADKYQYGQDDYFAYPLETIFYGMGDCEDTSILAAGLFKALEYDTGVVIVPGHAFAAVGLDSYTPGIYSARSYEIISQTISGVNYYACETTVSTPQEIGLVSLSGYRGEPYSGYIGKDAYGFYIV